VARVNLVLWGSTANPQSCKLQASLLPARGDGWQEIDNIDVPSQFAHAHTHTLLRPVESRYWRLVVRSNWGATWGVGLQRVRFLGDAGASSTSADTAAQQGLQQLSHFAEHGFQGAGAEAAAGHSSRAAVVAAFAGSAAVLVVWCMWSRLAQWWTPWAASTYVPVALPSTPGTRVFVRRVRTDGAFAPHSTL